jgi:hypothetical protein
MPLSVKMKDRIIKMVSNQQINYTISVTGFPLLAMSLLM